MRSKHHSYYSKRNKTLKSSTIIITAMSIILVLLLGNYFVTLHNSQNPSSGSSLKSNRTSSTKTLDDNSKSTDTSASQEKNLLAEGIKSQAPTIIIDAGHGGPDPGKVSDTGTLEKDINLNIALYLKEMLESQDMNVIMIREEDKDLATDTKKRKLSDIKARVNIMENSNADMVISIHQNSYPDSSVYGAQCFYPTNSEEGKNLATTLQNQIIESTNQTKIREIKANDDYYLLKHSSTPIVIVECGFLTNPEEEQMLLSDDYQRKMAWAIHLGCLKYLNGK